MSTEEQTKGLYKRGKIYWLYYSYRGVSNRISTKTESINETINFKYKLIEKLNKENIENKNDNINYNNNPHTLYFVTAKFIENKKRKLKEKTIKNYIFCIKNIMEFFDEYVLINDITKLSVKDYENHRIINGCSDGELLKELSIFREIFNYAVDNELMENNLFDRYNFKKNYKNYEPRTKFLTPDECKNIIDNSNKYLKRLIIFLLETGLRINEALNIEFSDISIDIQTKRNYLRIRKELSKNKKERFVPLSKEAMEQVNKQRIDFKNNIIIFTDGKGNYYKTTPKSALKTALKRTNIQNIKKIWDFIYLGILSQVKNYRELTIGVNLLNLYQLN